MLLAHGWPRLQHHMYVCMCVCVSCRLWLLSSGLSTYHHVCLCVCMRACVACRLRLLSSVVVFSSLTHSTGVSVCVMRPPLLWPCLLGS